MPDRKTDAKAGRSERYLHRHWQPRCTPERSQRRGLM